MAPSFTPVDAGDSGFRNAKLFGEEDADISSILTAAYLAYFVWCEPGVFSQNVGGVKLVFTLGYPFEVVSIVVALVAILVVAFVLQRWRRTLEGLEDQPVNCTLMPFAVLRKAYFPVSIWPLSYREKLAGYCHSGSRCCAFETAYTAAITNLIAGLKSRYIAPLFGHISSEYRTPRFMLELASTTKRTEAFHLGL